MPDINRIIHIIRPGSFGRFLMTGGVNTIVGWGCFPLLYWLFGSPATMNILIVVSWLLSTGFGFLMHKFVTFRSGGPAHQEGFKFLLLALIILGINLVVMNVMASTKHFHPVLVQFVMNVVLSLTCMILNYFGMSRWIFATAPLAKSKE